MTPEQDEPLLAVLVPPPRLADQSLAARAEGPDGAVRSGLHVHTVGESCPSWRELLPMAAITGDDDLCICVRRFVYTPLVADCDAEKDSDRHVLIMAHRHACVQRRVALRFAE